MNVHHLVLTYGYAAVALLVLTESFGVPLPGETTLIAAAGYAGTTHKLSIWAIFLVAAAAASVGGMIGYWIGATGGWRLLRRFHRVLRIDEPKIKVARYLFDRRGGLVVFFARFVIVLRTYAAFLAGTSQMRFRRFAPFHLAGSVVWAAAYSFGAYDAGSFISRSSVGFEIGFGCLAVAVLVAVALVIRRHFSSLEARAEEAYPGSLEEWHHQRERQRQG